MNTKQPAKNFGLSVVMSFGIIDMTVIDSSTTQYNYKKI
jgi:hypothetical protein